jgi:hypothetical protein
LPLLTLGQAFNAKVRLIVWCKRCLHRFEPDTADLVERTVRRRQRMFGRAGWAARNVAHAMPISSSVGPSVDLAPVRGKCLNGARWPGGERPEGTFAKMLSKAVLVVGILSLAACSSWFRETPPPPDPYRGR